MLRRPNTSSLRWLWQPSAPRVAFLTVVCLCTLLSLAVGLFYYLSFPYVGFEFSNAIVGHIDPNGPAARAGMRLGDEIVAINDRPFATREGPYVSQHAESANYTIKRNGQEQNIVVHFNPSIPDDAFIKTMHFLSGFGLWLLGSLILFLRTDDERATLLIMCCFLASLTIAFLAFADLGADWASRIVATLLMLVSPMFVHYHSVFPERKALFGHRQLVLALVYAVGLLLFLMRVPFSAASLVEVGAYGSISALMRILIVICMFLGLGLMIHTRQTTANDLIKRQASLMSLGTGLSVLAMTVLVVLPQIFSGTYLLPTHFVFWLLFLIPLSYAYATYRHDLMNIDPKVNRTVAIAMLAFVLIGIYWVAWEVMFEIAPRLFLFIDSKTAGLVIVLLIGFSIAPLQRWIQKAVDTAFYGGWYDYRSIIQEVARNLNGVASMDKLTDHLVMGLVNGLHVKSAALLVATDEDQSLRVQKAIGFESARIQRDSALAKYLATHPEPIEHRQLEAELKRESTDAQKELAAWRDAQLWVPLVKEGELEGVLVLGLKEVEDFFSQEDRLILSTLAHQAAIALQNINLLETLRQRLNEVQLLSRELICARDEEQERIARELHDTAIQELVGMKLRIEHTANDPEQQATLLAGLSDDIEQVADTLRNVYKQLQHQLALKEFGLATSVRNYARRFEAQYEIPVRLETDHLDGESLSYEAQSCLYRAVQVALVNVHRHSHATYVDVSLSQTEDEALLEVKDNGCGFEVPNNLARLAEGDHFGLSGLEQRAELLGGTLEIQSAPGRGTTLRVYLPLIPIVSPTLIVERSQKWNHGKPMS